MRSRDGAKKVEKQTQKRPNPDQSGTLQESDANSEAKVSQDQDQGKHNPVGDGRSNEMTGQKAAGMEIEMRSEEEKGLAQPEADARLKPTRAMTYTEMMNSGTQRLG